MEAIKLCRLDTPIIFIEARINLSRFVVTGCAAKTSATVTFPRSEERFSRNAETDLVCRLLLEKKKKTMMISQVDMRVFFSKWLVVDITGLSMHILILPLV